MGRFVRSVFVVVAVVCLLMSEGLTLAGFSDPPLARLVVVGFIVLLQEPVFGRQAEAPRSFLFPAEQRE